MLRIFKFLLLILFSSVVLTACSYEKGLILFNNEPITKQNVVHDKKTFTVGSKVYYIFLAPEKINNEFIRVQIFKMTDKAPWGGHEVVRTKDYRLMQNERYYHTDYFVLHEKGRYVMQVFSHDDFLRPLALNDFYVQ